MVYILLRVSRSSVMRHGSQTVYRPRPRNYREIFEQALPTSSAMAVMLFGSFVAQLYLKQFGPEAIAAYGVGLRIEQLLLLPGFGLTIALLPIASQNLGACEYDRVRQSFAFCCKGGCRPDVLGGDDFVGSRRGRRWVCSQMIRKVIRIGGNYLNVDGFMLPVYILLFAMNSLLQAFKRPIYTLWIGLYRQGFGIAVFSGIYVFAFGMDSWGVWFGIATSVTTGCLLAFAVTSRVARKEIGGCFAGRRPVSQRPATGVSHPATGAISSFMISIGAAINHLHPGVSVEAGQSGIPSCSRARRGAAGTHA